MKIRRVLSVFLLSVLLTALCLTPQALALEAPTLDAKCALLMDETAGRMLYGHNEKEKAYPASITKIIYHSVAQQMNSEGSNVERNMRYAVHRAWDKCDKAVLARYFGEARAQDKEPPSNREFCAALVEYLRQEACRL